MTCTFISNSVTETHTFAKELLSELSTNLICLYGELGAGKTTFVQGLARALGIKKRILSPSFVLVREYKINVKSPFDSAQGRRQLKVKNLHHIDCYRINSEQDIKSIDLKEIWSDPANLVVVEWAERVQKILPQKRIDIKFEYIGEKKREISVCFTPEVEASGDKKDFLG